MDQINNALLDMIQQMMQLPKPAKPGTAEKPSEESQFQDLMNKYQQNGTKENAVGQKPAPGAAEKPQADGHQAEGGQNPASGATNWQEQMVLAAMAMLSNPVVPMDLQTALADGEVTVEQIAQLVLPTGTQTVEVQQPEMHNGDPAGQQTQGQEQLLGAPQEKGEAPVQVQPGQIKAEMTNETITVYTPRGEKKAAQQELEVKVTENPEQRVFGEVETAPVKVGEVSQPERPEEAESIEKQVLKPLTKALKEGNSKVEIQLNPAQLGNVKVELTKQADGSLQVVLTAEKSSTQALLDKHASNLQAALLNQNQEPVRVYVQQQESQNPQDNYPQDGNQGGQPQEQHHRRPQDEAQDFLQQLRLGLIPAEDESDM